MSIAQHSRLVSERRHDVDALRVLAFGLLILYHVAMFYVAEWGWHIKSEYQFTWLQLPMLVLNQWRMALIFVVSGLAVSFAWGKHPPGIFAVRRFSRLFVPLIFGMAVIVAPQNYYEALSNGAIERGFMEFFGTYLAGGDIPAKAYDDADTPMWTWNHLWYLPYLLGYTLALIPIALFLRGPGQRVLSLVRRIRGVGLILIPIVPLILYGTFIFPRFPYINHGLTGDWYAHAMYFTFFLYGFLIGNDDGLWKQLHSLRKHTLSAAIVSFIAFYLLNILLPDDSFVGHDQLALVAVYLNRWLWIIAILGWGRHMLNRPFGWLRYATVAVYPWYILHQTILISVGYELSQLQLGPVAEPTLVLIATIGGCLILHECVIKRVGLLRYLFGVPIAKSKHADQLKHSGA